MSIFTCYECDQYKDADDSRCVEFPIGSGENVCENCYYNLIDDIIKINKTI